MTVTVPPSATLPGFFGSRAKVKSPDLDRLAGDTVHVLCIGASAPPSLAPLGLLAEPVLPWVVCIERAALRHDYGCSELLLGAAGFQLFVEGPTVAFWVHPDAPPAVLRFSYAEAIVIAGPAMPVVLLPAPLQVDELMAVSNDRFVAAAYWSVLRRPVDGDGLAHYGAALRDGLSRVQVLRELAWSAEALARGVGGPYRDLGAADPSAARRPWWQRVAARHCDSDLGAFVFGRWLAKLRGSPTPSHVAARTGSIEKEMDWPHYKISYAQNFEDLVLAGLFKGLASGFYADVGANHPVLDSVTKIFYDKGWNGINVEPNDELYSLLSEQRPRDINIKAAASSQPGSLTLRIYDGLDGLSTISRETQAVHAASLPDNRHRDVEVPVVCLSDLFARYRPSGDIHFLKVDVEGLELEVLLGNDWGRFRPWVLCLERNLHPARQEAIRTYLGALSYRAVFWDGINDFFVADERREVWDNFSYANDVVLNGVPVNYIFVRAMESMAKEAAGRG